MLHVPPTAVLGFAGTRALVESSLYAMSCRCSLVLHTTCAEVRVSSRRSGAISSSMVWFYNTARHRNDNQVFALTTNHNWMVVVAIAMAMANGLRLQVAIKKIPGAFDDLVDAKRIVREIRLLRHFNHENVMKVVDILPPSSLEDFDVRRRVLDFDVRYSASRLGWKAEAETQPSQVASSWNDLS